MKAHYALPLLRTAHGLVAMSIVIGSQASGRNAVLKLDGVLKVDQFALAGARMVIVSADDEVEIRTSQLSAFTMEVDLQTTYLFSFERSGCVTKELYFDTRVPERFIGNAPFEFPFQVTLTPPPPGQDFKYSGPVGHIHFVEKHRDFAYDTDYSKVADPQLAERMRQVLTELTAPAIPLTASGQAMQPLPTIKANEPLVDGDPNGELVRTKRTAPPLVHVTSGHATNVISAEAVVPESTEGTTEHTADEVPTVVEKTEPPVISMNTAVHEPIPDRPVQPELEMFSAPTTVNMISDVQRTEETIVEPRWVTTIVRLTSNGRTKEYRRVVQHYGQTFYFKDGVSCTDHTFAKESAR